MGPLAKERRCTSLGPKDRGRKESWNRNSSHLPRFARFRLLKPRDGSFAVNRLDPAPALAESSGRLGESHRAQQCANLAQLVETEGGQADFVTLLVRLFFLRPPLEVRLAHHAVAAKVAEQLRDCRFAGHGRALECSPLHHYRVNAK